jgi:hypothetical protein
LVNECHTSLNKINWFFFCFRLVIVFASSCSEIATTALQDCQWHDQVFFTKQSVLLINLRQVFFTKQSVLVINLRQVFFNKQSVLVINLMQVFFTKQSVPVINLMQVFYTKQSVLVINLIQVFLPSNRSDSDSFLRRLYGVKDGWFFFGFF